MTGDEVRLDTGALPAAATVSVQILHLDDAVQVLHLDDAVQDLRADDEGAEPPGALVSFVGEIDLGTAPALGESVLGQTVELRRVVLDLSAVTFLDSAGVRLLDTLVGAYEARGNRVRLVAPEHGVARFTLTLCAFRSDLVESSVDRARASLVS